MSNPLQWGTAWICCDYGVRFVRYLHLAVFISLQNEIHMSVWLSAIALLPSRCFLILTSFCVWAEQGTLPVLLIGGRLPQTLPVEDRGTLHTALSLSLYPVNVPLKGRRRLTGWLSLGHVFFTSTSITSQSHAGTQPNHMLLALITCSAWCFNSTVKHPSPTI